MKTEIVTPNAFVVSDDSSSSASKRARLSGPSGPDVSLTEVSTAGVTDADLSGNGSQHSPQQSSQQQVQQQVQQQAQQVQQVQQQPAQQQQQQQIHISPDAEGMLRCHECSKQFRRVYDLHRHQRLHSGIKPHVCTRCGKKFSRADALIRHMRPTGSCATRGPIVAPGEVEAATAAAAAAALEVSAAAVLPERQLQQPIGGLGRPLQPLGQGQAVNSPPITSPPHKASQPAGQGAQQAAANAVNNRFAPRVASPARTEDNSVLLSRLQALESRTQMLEQKLQQLISREDPTES